MANTEAYIASSVAVTSFFSLLTTSLHDLSVSSLRIKRNAIILKNCVIQAFVAMFSLTVKIIKLSVEQLMRWLDTLQKMYVDVRLQFSLSAVFLRLCVRELLCDSDSHVCLTNHGYSAVPCYPKQQ